MQKRLFAVMADLRDCQVTIRDGSDAVVLGTPAADPTQTLHVGIVVHDPAFYRMTALNGSVGAGEAYMDGHWDCDDLVEVLAPRPEWSSHLWLVTHVDLHRTVKVQKFLAHLKAEAAGWTDV